MLATVRPQAIAKTATRAGLRAPCDSSRPRVAGGADQAARSGIELIAASRARLRLKCRKRARRSSAPIADTCRIHALAALLCWTPSANVSGRRLRNEREKPLPPALY